MRALVLLRGYLERRKIRKINKIVERDVIPLLYDYFFEPNDSMTRRCMECSAFWVKRIRDFHVDPLDHSRPNDMTGQFYILDLLMSFEIKDQNINIDVLAE